MDNDAPTEQVEAPQSAETAPVITPVAEAEEKPGNKFVKIDDPDVKARFDKVYGQLKFQQRVNEELIKRQQAIEAKLQETETKHTQKEQADSEAVIKHALAKAHEDGNYRAVAELTDKLVTLKAKPVEAPKPQPQQTQNDLTPDQQAAFVAWASERDQTGNLKRPWAFEDQPGFDKAVEVTNRVLQDPSISMNGMASILRAIDNEMAPKKPAPTTAAVLNSEGRRVTSKQLSPEEKYIAGKMGLTEAQYLEGKGIR